jgi:hypothetical protein
MLFQSLSILYLLIKAAYFASLLKAFVGSEALQSKPLMMALMYTAGVGGLSYFYLYPVWQQNPNWMWTWVGLSLAASYVFYWILARYEDVWVIWWTTLIGGTILIIFFV